MNKVILKGNITKELELKYTSSNIAVLKFNLAVSRNYTNQNGERETDFINCVAYRNIAENITKYFGKGSSILVCGRIQTGSYQDKDNKKVYTTDIVIDEFDFIDKKTSNEEKPKTEEIDKKYVDFGNSVEDKSQAKILDDAMNEESDPFKEFGQEVALTDEDLPF